MKPLKGNPMKEKVKSEKQKKYEQELKAFLEDGCEFAELWRDEDTLPQSNIEGYKREARQMKLGREDLKFFQKDFKVYVQRLRWQK